MTDAMQKTAAAVHDLSGFGKCSLTVILPVLSAAGIACSAVPTAVLSSHTGGLSGVYHQDFTQGVRAFTRQWSDLSLRFDALYTGYMSSPGQIAACEELVSSLRRRDTLFLADPALGDHGRLYQGISKETADAMLSFCRGADLILPNRTEAALLLGEELRDEMPERAEAALLLPRLAQLGPRRVVLTGVSFSQESIGAACYDAETGKIDFAAAPRVQGHFHGTGDLFGAALLAGLLCGRALPEAMQMSVHFVSRSIFRTWRAGTDPRFGVDFEEELPSLMRELRLL